MKIVETILFAAAIAAFLGAAFVERGSQKQGHIMLAACFFVTAAGVVRLCRK